MGGRLGEEEIIVFSFGSFGKGLDSTTSSASGKNGIYLSLCRLKGYWFVQVRDHVVVIINSKLISMHIKYYV